VTTDIAQWVRDEDAAWASRDVERILSLYAENCVYEDLAAGKYSKGRTQIRAYLEEAFRGIPDFRVELKSFFGSADRVCSEGVMRGTHTGSIVGLPAPTGKAFAVPYAHVCQLRDGKAVRITDYYDMVSMLRQLGLLSGSV
jgi:steroid delta-isomerase-like uncharacterized protein